VTPDGILRVLSCLGVGAVVFGNRSVVEYANDEFAELLGYRSAGELIGSGIGQVIDTSDLAVRDESTRRPTREGAESVWATCTLIHRSGMRLYNWVRRWRVPVDGTLPTLMIIEESADTPDGLSGVRERWLADHDELTSLLNRRGFNRAVRDGRTEFPATLVVVDVDAFKAINDRYGHHTGDLVLRAFAGQLGHIAVLHGGVCARFGGDEFVLLVAAGEADRALRRLKTLVHDNTVEVPGGSVVFTVSYGWSQVLNPDQIDHARVRADGHMYDARSVKGGPPRQGRHNRVRIGDPREDW